MAKVFNMGSKKLQVWLPLLFAIVMVVGMMIGYKIKEQTGSSQGFLKMNRRDDVQEVLDLVKNKYVDAVNLDTLNDLAINMVLAHLDPHSVYISPADVADVSEDLMGNFQGIGVEYEIIDDTINLTKIIPEGPAAKAGLKPDDQIIKVNDTVLLTGKKLLPETIKKNLRGPAGSQVKITLQRDHNIQNIVVTRGTIPVPSADVAYMIAPETGYIRLTKFSERTYEEFMQQLEKLQKQGMKKMVLDLRNNGGGLLQQAVKIADEFLDDNKLIVYTQGDHSEKMEYHCRKEGLFEKGKLVVLVNEFSASASEVLSGALQDWDRATIVGRRTFGKGLVQQQFPLNNGGAIRLTVARYYTPLGRNIQKPYSGGKEKYQEELMNRFHDGEVLKPDTSKPGGPTFKTPSGKAVYGGGGITPDVFVPIDTTDFSYKYRSPNDRQRNFINRATLLVYKNHKTAFSNFKSVEHFSQDFNITNEEWRQLLQIAKKDSLYLNDADKKAVEWFVKPMIAFKIWDMKGYLEVLNNRDNAVLKSLELLK